MTVPSGIFDGHDLDIPAISVIMMASLRLTRVSNFTFVDDHR